jgi:hypothetical protein
MRRQLLDFHVWHANENCMEGDFVSKTCAEFANDLIKALVKTRLVPDMEELPWEKDPKSYRIKENKETKNDSCKSKGVAKA